MNKKEIIQKITGQNGQKPFLTAATYELDGVSVILRFSGADEITLSFTKDEVTMNGKNAAYRAVKTEDTRFLVGFNGMLLILELSTGEGCLLNGLNIMNSFAATTNPLTGWETEIHFGAYMTYVCRFTENSMEIDDISFPASYVPLSEGQILVALENDEQFIGIVVDIDRFLIYGGMNGSPNIGGCIEVLEE